eukprot:scaffold3808_cov112-Isochrysis_galbana.AAC.25
MPPGHPAPIGLASVGPAASAWPRSQPMQPPARPPQHPHTRRSHAPRRRTKGSPPRLRKAAGALAPGPYPQRQSPPSDWCSDPRPARPTADPLLRPPCQPQPRPASAAGRSVGAVSPAPRSESRTSGSSTSNRRTR